MPINYFACEFAENWSAEMSLEGFLEGSSIFLINCDLRFIFIYLSLF